MVRCKNALLIHFAVFAAVLPYSMAALAEDNLSAQVEVGIIYSSEDSFKFGEYSGLEEQGVYALGDIRISKMSAYDDESTEYWGLEGDNLGLDSRSLFAEYGHQGKFSAYFNYDQTPHFQFADTRTPFLGSGTSRQTLPAGWLAADSTAGLSNLLSNLKTETLRTERQKFDVGLSWLFTERLELRADYSHEKKDGRDSLAAIFGTNGGNPRGALLVTPVDFETNDYNLSLSYADRKFQFSLAYHLSVFDNSDNSLVWDNPFIGPSGFNTWSFDARLFPDVQGQLALAPDNEAHQFAFRGGYNFGMSSRISANVSIGRRKQDEQFLPYTSNPNLIVTSALPRSNLSGQVDTTFVDLSFSSRPLRKLSVRANYIYDDQDNDTPRNIYQIVHSDSGNQGALLSSSARVNTPYSFERHQFRLDGAYRLKSASKLQASYEYEKRLRDFVEVEDTEEHTGSVKLSSSIGASMSGWIEYSHSKRDSSTYISNRPFLSGHNPDYVATLALNARHVQDPLLRKFSYADRQQDKVKAMLNIIPADPVTLSVSADYADIDHDNSELGLTDSSAFNVTFDASYAPNKDLTAYLFLTREDMEYTQHGYERFATALFPGIVRDPPLCGACGFWSNKHDDEVYVAGAGFDLVVIEDKFKIEFDYNYLRSETEIVPSGDPNLTFSQLPDLTSRLHRVKFNGEYRYNETTDIIFAYHYERLKINDFTLDNVGPNTMANIISLGNSNHNYNAHVLSISLQHNF